AAAPATRLAETKAVPTPNKTEANLDKLCSLCLSRANLRIWYTPRRVLQTDVARLHGPIPPWRICRPAASWAACHPRPSFERRLLAARTLEAATAVSADWNLIRASRLRTGYRRMQDALKERFARTSVRCG